MNCLEFRRQFLVDPRTAEESFLRHKRECPKCADFIAAQSRFEQSVLQALNVDVPKELSARIVFAQTTRAENRRRFFALAASIVFTLAIVGGFMLGAGEKPLERVVLAHIEGEPELLNASELMAPAKVARALAPIGVELKGGLGEVRYAGVCRMRARDGGHVVLAGRRGPVSVLLMPDEVVSARKQFHDGRFTGVIVPARNGSIAIVGERHEALEPIEQRLTANLRVQF